ncbi:MAG: 6-carboxytetrahydropterin synthase [Fimbriimonadaceae bacterium]|nr:6-carboxytetrahydropterin synthase [Fimbriimonadaceae bacterium]
MPEYRVSKAFTVESGHMLSQHPERCRFPHGHTRTVEVVVRGAALDAAGMLVDFKALKLAVQSHIDRYDHALAVNSRDPFLPQLQAQYPEDALVIFRDAEPTTEAIAAEIGEYVQAVLREGFSHGPYVISPGQVGLAYVRVTETPSSWAEYWP